MQGVLSMLLAALIVHFSEKIVLRVVSSEWLMRSMELTKIAAQSFGTERHAIICGFGRNGQHLARFLTQEGISYVALDLDPDRVRDAAVIGAFVLARGRGWPKFIVPRHRRDTCRLLWPSGLYCMRGSIRRDGGRPDDAAPAPGPVAAPERPRPHRRHG